MPLAESLSVTNEASQSLEKVTSEVKVFENFQNHSCDNPDYEALVGALNTLNQNRYRLIVHFFRVCTKMHTRLPSCDVSFCSILLKLYFHKSAYLSM